VAASSLRRNVVSITVLGGLIAGIACLLQFGKVRLLRPWATGFESRFGPHLAFGRGTIEQYCGDADGSKREHELRTAAWLTFATLNSEARSKLLDLIDAVLDSLEAQSHPLVYDLAEETPEALVRHEAPWLLPIWTASRSIARTCFSGGNGMLTVVVNDAKATLPPHFRSVDALDTTEGDSDLRLSRFLAWPITSARRVRATNSESATALWAQLRAKTWVRQSTVALVIDKATQNADVASLVGVQMASRLIAMQARMHRWKNVDCKGCDMLSSALLAWSKGPPAAPVLPWLDLRETEAWVVPRLGALSQPERFASETDAALQKFGH
jgi:hypothetical protein